MKSTNPNTRISFPKRQCFATFQFDEKYNLTSFRFTVRMEIANIFISTYIFATVQLTVFIEIANIIIIITYWKQKRIYVL